MKNLSLIKTTFSGLLPGKTVTVPIDQCTHYCGFRYGRNEYNPYETYIIELHKGVTEKKRKDTFIDFLMYYRPETFGEALGIELSRRYPLWQYPWFSNTDPFYNAHDMEVDLIPDIITHFSKLGIPYKRIEGEFQALEAAYHSILQKGYLPGQFGYAQLLCLDNSDTKAYILLDGNHRVSALSALEQTQLAAKLYKKYIIKRENHMNWPGVKNGFFTPEDALKIFDLYFKGNHSYRTTNVPAKIINE